VLTDPEHAAARAIRELARSLTHRPRGLSGMKLPLSVQG
jgi:ATP-binding protein involved in chromosome partitioning